MLYSKKKKKKKKKNTNPSWGLTHPPTSEFFSIFLIFFNLTKPLSSGVNGLKRNQVNAFFLLLCHGYDKRHWPNGGSMLGHLPDHKVKEKQPIQWIRRCI